MVASVIHVDGHFRSELWINRKCNACARCKKHLRELAGRSGKARHYLLLHEVQDVLEVQVVVVVLDPLADALLEQRRGLAGRETHRGKQERETIVSHPVQGCAGYQKEYVSLVGQSINNLRLIA